jgi:dTDP-4-amino-4,6-dideoxygalactose transaminase
VAAIKEYTRAIVARFLFGYPLDMDALGDVMHAAEQCVGHKIRVVQDSPHTPSVPAGVESWRAS